MDSHLQKYRAVTFIHEVPAADRPSIAVQASFLRGRWTGRYCEHGSARACRQAGHSPSCVTDPP